MQSIHGDHMLEALLVSSRVHDGAPRIMFLQELRLNDEAYMRRKGSWNVAPLPSGLLEMVSHGKLERGSPPFRSFGDGCQQDS